MKDQTDKSDTNGQTTTDISNANINSDEAVKASVSESEMVLNNNIDVINESAEEAVDLNEAEVELKIDDHENSNDTLVTGVCAQKNIDSLENVIGEVKGDYDAIKDSSEKIADQDNTSGGQVKTENKLTTV